MIRTYCLLLFVAFLGFGCKEDVLRGMQIDGEVALSHVKTQIAFGERISGSEELYQTAKWLETCINSFGYDGKIDSWKESTVTGDLMFHNVSAQLPGTLPGRIILGSHFDLKKMPGISGFQGANDSASSTAVLLEIMRILKKSNLELPTIEFWFFDGEECQHQYGLLDGLHGSKKVARDIATSKMVKEYRAMILLDMVGDNDLKFDFSADTDPTLYKYVYEQAKHLGESKRIEQTFSLLIHDDHVPFKNLGIPTINFIDFNFGPNNSYWHTLDDSIENVSSKSMEISGNLVLALILKLANEVKVE